MCIHLPGVVVYYKSAVVHALCPKMRMFTHKNEDVCMSKIKWSEFKSMDTINLKNSCSKTL